VLLGLLPVPRALLVVLRPVLLSTLVLTGLATLLLAIELDRAPALLGVLVVVFFHAIRHCWLLSTTMSPRELCRAAHGKECNGHTTDEADYPSSVSRL
jgi:hypothetical protein